MSLLWKGMIMLPASKETVVGAPAVVVVLVTHSHQS